VNPVFGSHFCRLCIHYQDEKEDSQFAETYTEHESPLVDTQHVVGFILVA
jgi:hypothetical protein